MTSPTGRNVHRIDGARFLKQLSEAYRTQSEVRLRLTGTGGVVMADEVDLTGVDYSVIEQRAIAHMTPEERAEFEAAYGKGKL